MHGWLANSSLRATEVLKSFSESQKLTPFICFGELYKHCLTNRSTQEQHSRAGHQESLRPHLSTSGHRRYGQIYQWTITIFINIREYSRFEWISRP